MQIVRSYELPCYNNKIDQAETKHIQQLEIESPAEKDQLVVRLEESHENVITEAQGIDLQFATEEIELKKENEDEAICKEATDEIEVIKEKDEEVAEIKGEKKDEEKEIVHKEKNCNIVKSQVVFDIISSKINSDL